MSMQTEKLGISSIDNNKVFEIVVEYIFQIHTQEKPLERGMWNMDKWKHRVPFFRCEQAFASFTQQVF